MNIVKCEGDDRWKPETHARIAKTQNIANINVPERKWHKMPVHRSLRPHDRKCPYWSSVGCTIPGGFPIPVSIPDEDNPGDYIVKIVSCPCHDGAGCILEGYIPVADEEAV
jgi:hypothetical protein